ncbi:EOG090X0OQM [Symbiodinium sp. KB8]|nr:EOG090X0OQM [Symbiodinium sp. KB8]
MHRESTAALGSAGDWEDEDAEATEEVAPKAAAPAAPVVVKEKHLKKAALAEAAAKEKAKDEALARAQAAHGEPSDDPAEERLRLERIQKQADLQIAEDTFGLGDDEAVQPGVATDDVAGQVGLLPLKVAAQHDTIADAMATELYSGRSRLNGLKFVKSFLYAVKEHMTVDDLADIIAILNTAKNSKLSAAKPKGKKGKKGKKAKAFARVETTDDLMAEGVQGSSGLGAEYDDFM